ncbi:MAG TPA: hypothetical protein VJ745_07295 [Gaiellaceae bacterium]|nr:hypothetical protein [Gaiellaceae bacterium]
MARRGLRDSTLGRLALLAIVLLAAFAVARTCGSRDQQISQEEAVAIATENASFVPCEESGCVLVRALNQGIPPRLVWIVGLAERLGPDGEPTRFENFEVDAATGTVRRRP